MTNSITRVFLGWDQPLLVTAVEWLARRYGSAGELNLGGAVVVDEAGAAAFFRDHTIRLEG